MGGRHRFEAPHAAGKRVFVRSGVQPERSAGLLGIEKTGVELWDLAAGEKVRSFQGHTEIIDQVAFSPDGRQILTGSRDGTAILWERATGKKLRVFEVCKSGGGVAFSPDGRHVFTCAADGVILREAATGRPIRTFPTVTQEGLGTLALSADGKRLLAGVFRSPAILWDVGTGKELGTFDVGRVSGRHLAISPDGRHVLLEVGDVARPATLWEVASGRKVRTFPEPQDFTGGPVCFSPDGKYVLLSWGLKGAALWEPGTGRKVRSFGGRGDRG